MNINYSIKEPGRQAKYFMYYDISKTKTKQTELQGWEDDCVFSAGHVNIRIGVWISIQLEYQMGLAGLLYLEGKDREAILGTNCMARIAELVSSWFSILDREQLGKTLSINLQSPYVFISIFAYIYPHNTYLSTNVVQHCAGVEDTE